MKIALPSRQNIIDDHFGHCEGFKLYDVVNGKIEHEDFIKNPGHKPGFLPNYLSGRGVNIIISSGMGSSAQKLFKEKSIEVIVGCEGSLDKIIKSYIDGSLVSDKSVCNKHEFDGNCND